MAKSKATRTTKAATTKAATTEALTTETPTTEAPTTEAATTETPTTEAATTETPTTEAATTETPTTETPTTEAPTTEAATTETPTREPPEYEYPEIAPIDAFRSWVQGKPFRESIAKLSKPAAIAYINQITAGRQNNHQKPKAIDEETKRFWDGYKAGLLGKEKIADDEIFSVGYDSALGGMLKPRKKPKKYDVKPL